MAWKIGEVVARTGLTTRALHFYEARGLIGPVARNEAGHRLYSRSDLLKLQQIRTLRQLGVPLGDMPPLLNQDDQLLPQLRRHLSRLRQQRAEILNVESKVSRLVEMLEGQSAASGELDIILFDTLESMTMYEKYFKKDEIESIHDQAADSDSEKTLAVAWQQCVAAMEAAIASGVSPQSPAAQSLLQEWEALVTQMTGGDEDKRKAFHDLMHDNPQARADHGLGDHLFEFIAEARQDH